MIFGRCSPAVLVRLCFHTEFYASSYPYDGIPEGREDHQLREQHAAVYREAARRLHAQSRGEVRGPLIFNKRAPSMAGVLFLCTALKASKLQSTDEAKTSRTACDDSFGISVTYCPEAPRPRLSVCNAYKLHEPLKARCILVPNHQSFSARGERVLTDKDRAQFLTF